MRRLMWVLSAALVTQAALAQPTITPSIGFSKDYRTQTENRWKPGLNIGATVFWKSAGPVSFGVRGAFHHWSADGDGWAKDEAELQGFTTYTLSSFSGTQNVIELGPAVQFGLAGPAGKVKAQAGLMVVSVMRSDVSLSGSYTTGASSGTGTITYTSATTTGAGAEFALPISLGLFQVRPSVTLYNSDDLYAHFSLTVGRSFGVLP